METHSIFFIILFFNRKIEDPSVDNHTLQPGKNIIYSGYAVYGSGTVLYISLVEHRVDGFLLDPVNSQ